MSWVFFLIFSLSVCSAEEYLDRIDVQAKKDIDLFTFSSSDKITEQNLEGQSLGLVSPALEKIPGLVANQNGGPGGRVSFFLRGTESRHVSFVLDGLKANDPSNTDRQFDAAFLTSPFVRTINIYKGPQAVLYGSDAMGGLIDIRTKKGEEAPQTKLTVSGGSFGTIASSLLNDWKTNSSRGTLTATRFHSDGISRLNKKRFRATEKDGTDISQLTSSSHHRLTKRIETEILASYNHGKAEQDGFAADNSHDFSRNDQYILQQKTNFEIDKTQAFSLRNGFNRHQRLNDSLAVGKEFFNGELLQNELIHRKDFESVHFLSGLSSEHEAAKAINLNRSFDLHSLFVQTSLEKNVFKLHGGVRADRHTKYGSFYTGSAGIGIYNFSFQYSQGYKAPTLYQLFGPDIFGSPVGNSDLRPETNHYLEASWKETYHNGEISLSLFQNRLSNLVTFSFGKGYFNQQRFIAEGIELSGKKRFRFFEFVTSFTHQNFRQETTPVLRRPNNIAQAGVSYFIKESLELNINGRWYSSRYDVDNSGNTAKLNGYEVFDLGLRKVWENDEVSVQVKNLLNRQYEELFGFSVLPRSIFVSYGHRF